MSVGERLRITAPTAGRLTCTRVASHGASIYSLRSQPSRAPDGPHEYPIIGALPFILEHSQQCPDWLSEACRRLREWRQTGDRSHPRGLAAVGDAGGRHSGVDNCGGGSQSRADPSTGSSSGRNGSDAISKRSGGMLDGLLEQCVRQGFSTWSMKWLGAPRYYFITDPACLEHVLKTKFDNYPVSSTTREHQALICSVHDAYARVQACFD